MKILGIEIFDITLGFADRPEPADDIVSNTGGAFELAGEADPEWEPSEDWEEEDSAGKAGRPGRFGFRV